MKRIPKTIGFNSKEQEAIYRASQKVGLTTSSFIRSAAVKSAYEVMGGKNV